MSGPLLLLVQPFQPPDGEGHLLSLQEIQALPVIVEHGAGILPAGGSDVTRPRVVFLSVPVYKGKLDPASQQVFSGSSWRWISVWVG